MTCKKCGYQEKEEVNIFGHTLCKICATFAPELIHDFQNYIAEKLDWTKIDTFRKYNKQTNSGGDKGNRSIDGVVQSKDAWTTAPNYVNPLAFESGNNFSATDAFQVLGTGYNKMFGSGDKNEDGLKDGAFRDLKGKRKRNQLRKGDYYNYEIDIDKNDPTSYGFDNLDLYNASNNNGNLRDLQTFTNDVNENSRANYNTETGKYDSIMSSRSLDKDVYGNLNAYSGKNLNYFKNVNQDTKQQILDYAETDSAVLTTTIMNDIIANAEDRIFRSVELDNFKEYETPVCV